MFLNSGSLSIPWQPESEGDAEKSRPRAAATETTPSNKEPVKWVVVAEMPGLTPATIIAERLRLYDIPVRVWQESVGQAFGLAFGPMGTGFVAVPADFAAQAQAILAAPEDTGDGFNPGENELV